MNSYDFSDLVLLIGTNPLPNFVVAKHFMEHNPNLHRIWMIISERTQTQLSTKKLADNLISVLREINKDMSNKIDTELVSIRDIGDAESIEEKNATYN